MANILPVILCGELSDGLCRGSIRRCFVAHFAREKALTLLI